MALSPTTSATCALSFSYGSTTTRLFATPPSLPVTFLACSLCLFQPLLVGLSRLQSSPWTTTSWSPFHSQSAISPASKSSGCISFGLRCALDLPQVSLQCTLNFPTTRRESQVALDTYTQAIMLFSFLMSPLIDIQSPVCSDCRLSTLPTGYSGIKGALPHHPLSCLILHPFVPSLVLCRLRTTRGAMAQGPKYFLIRSCEAYAGKSNANAAT